MTHLTNQSEQSRKTSSTAERCWEIRKSDSLCLRLIHEKYIYFGETINRKYNPIHLRFLCNIDAWSIMGLNWHSVLERVDDLRREARNKGR